MNKKKSEELWSNLKPAKIIEGKLVANDYVLSHRELDYPTGLNIVCEGLEIQVKVVGSHHSDCEHDLDYDSLEISYFQHIINHKFVEKVERGEVKHRSMNKLERLLETEDTATGAFSDEIREGRY